MNTSRGWRLGVAGTVVAVALTGLAQATPPPPLQLQRTGTDTLAFSFHAATGQVHVIEFTDQLGAPTNWQPLPSFYPIPGEGESVTYFDSQLLGSSAPQRFFRLRSEWTLVELPDPLVRYDFTGSSPAPQEQDPEVTATAFAISHGTLGFGTAAPEAWEAGSGVPYAQGTTGWGNGQPEGAKHFTFTVAVASNRFLSVTNLSFYARATPEGPAALSVSVNGSLTPPQDLAANTTQFFDFPLSGQSDITQAVVRIKGWNNGSRSTTGGGWLYIDDVIALGEVEERPVDFVLPPTLELGIESDRTDSSATLAAAIVATGGAPIFERGFFWSLDPDFDPLEDGHFVQEFGEFGGGTFSLPLSGLPQGATLYYRAYAVNSAGLSLSPPGQFSTLADHELVFYGFTGNSRAAEAHRQSILPESVQISAGSTSYGWFNAPDWTAAGASEPYLNASGSGYWNRISQSEARSFNLDLAADNGWLISVTGITFLARASNAGPSAIGVSIDGTPVHAQDMPANQVITVHAAVTNIHQESTIQIKIQGWNNFSRETSGNGILRIDNVLLTGAMTMVLTTAPPTVVSPTSSGATDDRAWLGGTVTDNGGSSVIERGVYWSTDPAFTMPGGGFPLSDTAAGLGTFTVHAYQLPAGTTVYYRAYARTAAGEGATDVASFETPPLPAGLLANYTFSGRKVVPHQRHPHIIASHIARRDGRPGILTQNAASWTGSGVPYAQISSGFQWSHPIHGNYAVFALEARQGTTFTLTNVTFLARANENGPSAVSILLDNVVQHTQTLPANETILITVPVSGITDRSLTTLRIAGWDNGSRSTTGSGAFQFDDVLVQGSVSGTPAVPDTSGRRVRVASVNVRDGISEPGDADHDALRAILVRLDADVVAFQELYATETATIGAMAADLGYPHWEIAPNTGISGAQRVGFFSRYPFTATDVEIPPEANELTRAILRAVVDVPDAEQPLVVWAVHKKAMNDSLSQFRRAVETYRILEDIAAYHTAHPEHDEFVVLGDFNADFYTQEQLPAFSQSWFNQIESFLPASYAIGDDLAWPIPYARYPDDRYATAALPLSRVQMTQPGGFGTYSFLNAGFISRLDYIYASAALMARHPDGEIYYSLMDGPHPGLPKAGDPVAAPASWLSSDHLPVFADLHMTPIAVSPSSTAADPPIAPAQELYSAAAESETATAADPISQDTALPGPARAHSPSPDPAGSASSEPRLYLDRAPQGHLQLRFRSEPGLLYTLEAASLSAAAMDWTPLPNATDIPGTGSWIEYPLHPPPPRQTIYRLRIRP